MPSANASVALPSLAASGDAYRGVSKWWSPGDPTYVPAALPSAVSSAASVVYDGKIYSFGGYNANWAAEIDSVWEFDPITNSWTALTALPATTWAYAKAALWNHIAYFAANNGSFYGYGLLDGTTYTLATPTGGATWGHDAVAIGDYIYWKAAAAANFQRYDPVDDAWTALTEWPALGGDVQGASVVTDGTYLYVITRDLMGRYDPTLDSWTNLTGPPANLGLLARSAVLLNADQIMIAGGYDASFANPGDVGIYTISTDTWLTLPSLAGPHTAAAHGVIDGRFYVLGGEGDSGPITLSEAWAVDPPPVASDTLTVNVSTAFIDSGILPVYVSTDPADTVDAAATLPVRAYVGGQKSAPLAVIADTAEAETIAGTVATGTPTAVGASIIGAGDSYPLTQAILATREQFGGGLTATVEVEAHADLSTLSAVALDHVTTPITGGSLRHRAEFPVLPNAYGQSVDFGADGQIVTTGSTLDPWAYLATVTVSELLPVPASEDDPYTENTDLGWGDGDTADCDAAVAAGVPTGDPYMPAPGWKTRRELAEAALATVSYSLAILGSVPWQDRLAPADYRTDGKTVQDVVREMLLDSDPRFWVRDNVVTIDTRSVALLNDPSKDGTEWLGAGVYPVAGSLSYDTVPAGDPGDEPLLADYLTDCPEDQPPGEEDGGDPGTTVTGTFETFDNGTYRWTERSGTWGSIFGEPDASDYREVDHILTKVGGQLRSEATVTREQYRRSYTSGILTFGTVEETNVTNSYSSACPEALIAREETTRQRKRIGDIPSVSGTFGGEGPAIDYTAEETQRQIYEAMPDWYLDRSKRVEQRWHAEGYLRARTETTRSLRGMVATPAYETVWSGGSPGLGTPSQEQVGYDVTLTYETETRQEIFVPVGNGLWYVKTSIAYKQDKPIYELADPSAQEGDALYGVLEVTRIIAVPVVNNYTAVTDQAPPTISCGGIGDGTDDCDPRTCEERGTDEWQYDHDVWAAKVANYRPKRVWRFQAPTLRPDFTVGRIVNGGLVASVAHSTDGVRGSTDVEIWEFLT